LSDWTAGKEIAGLKQGQTYNMLQGKTTSGPIGKPRLFDRVIDQSVGEWLKTVKGWDWSDVVANMRPSMTKGTGYYDLTTPDGKTYLIQGANKDPMAKITSEDIMRMMVVQEFAP
jgi:hypothetical protein